MGERKRNKILKGIMKKEIKEKIKEFVDSLPSERREYWTNFGGGWYDYVVERKDSFEQDLSNFIEELLAGE